MELYLQASLSSFHSELQRQLEVYNVVRDMVDAVESKHAYMELQSVSAKFTLAEAFIAQLIKKYDALQKENASSKANVAHLSSAAMTLRRKFVDDVGGYLSERKVVKKLKEKIHVQEEELQHLKEQNASSDNASTHVEQHVVVGQENSFVPVIPTKGVTVIELEDPILLNVFSFLKTEEVLNFAQSCRYIFFRIDRIFGIESSIVEPQWGRLQNRSDHIVPPVTATHTTGSTHETSQAPMDPTPGSDVILTKDTIASVAKNLSAQDMKIVLNLADRLKKQHAQIQYLQAENSELKETNKAQDAMKDIFAANLNAAEQTIQSQMTTITSLKKQSASDNEIISYLDLHVQDLESQITELNFRCNQFQATLNLHLNSRSAEEERLGLELDDIRARHEKLDINFKSQKKLLVKEVKSLRAQVEALLMEKTRNQMRLQSVRDLFDNFGPATSNSMKPGNHKESIRNK